MIIVVCSYVYSRVRPAMAGCKGIIEHLFDTYGPGAENIPKELRGGSQGPPKSGKVKPNCRFISYTCDFFIF